MPLQTPSSFSSNRRCPPGFLMPVLAASAAALACARRGGSGTQAATAPQKADMEKSASGHAHTSHALQSLCVGCSNGRYGFF